MTVCLCSTKYNSHLAAHRRAHEGNVHRCTFEGCQYWSAKFTLLKAHLRAHNGEKNFKCDQCGKAFVEAGQLRRHIKTHSGSKPLSCPVEGCTYATNRSDKLKAHQARMHKVAVESSSPPKNRPSKLVLSMIQQVMMMMMTKQAGLEYDPAGGAPRPVRLFPLGGALR